MDGVETELVAEVTPAMLEGVSFDYVAHYNMGRRGYGYGYRCSRWPRLRFTDYVFKPTKEKPDGERKREWFVDGVECLDLGDALAALAGWPALTEDELRVLALVPADFAGLRKTEDDLAGVEHPKDGIRPNTPHSRVLCWLSSLCDKGLVEYGKNKNSGRSDGLPWSDAVPEHMRWSPTIRRSRHADHYLSKEGSGPCPTRPG